MKDAALSKQNSLASSWQAWLLNIGGSEFAADKVDYGGMPETLPREVPLSEPDDPFVADDTFQDQGPGSVEIYKLDLSKEKALLTATTPSAALPTRNKSKAPKKVDRVSSKTKTTEIKSTTSPKALHRQSNFFEEQRTETPVNRDAFGVGGVPELQVGCEGLAAWSHKTKRSIDTPSKEEASVPAVLLNASSALVDLEHDSYEVVYEDYEEMDELFKLRKMEELAAKRKKLNRGDIDPVLNAHYLKDRRSDDLLPVRGDLGETVSRSRTHREDSRKLSDGAGIRDHEEANAKRETVSSDDDGKSRGRRLLWLAEANTEGFAGDERKRAKRRIDWGFGEDEGVVSSDELQTVNERRRQHEMRYHQDARERDQRQRDSSYDPEVENIRREYERLLEQKRREEEERLRRVQQGDRRTPSRRQEEERRRDEMQRGQYEEYRRRTDYVSVPRADDEEARRQQLEERRRQEAAGNRPEEVARRNEEERRRWMEEERRRRLYEENTRRSGAPDSDEEARRTAEEQQRRSQDEARRRQEQYRSQQEAQRRREEEIMRESQGDPTRNYSEEYGRRLEEHRRQLQERQRQEDERRRQQDRGRNEIPANLMRTGHHRVDHPNELGQRDWDRERQIQEEERRREQKLREYIARNRPINVNRTNEGRNDDEYRRQVEEQRRRQEDELRRQDSIRRGRPSNVPPRSNQSIGRGLFDERRQIEEARQRSRYPDTPGAARRRGPWAPTNIDPRSSLEEVRRRQEARRLEEERRLARERQERYEAEERRKELARRQREEEARRLQEERRKEAVQREKEARREQSRKYEEDRKRLEAARVQAERRRQETLRERGWGGGRTVGGTRQPEATRSPYQDPRLVEHRRIQDSQPIPGNFVRDDARWLAERQRQQERVRLEAERRRQEEESR